jgi:regulator of protease activity HflC (stomatin/prohibitin superfamily)
MKFIIVFLFILFPIIGVTLSYNLAGEVYTGLIFGLGLDAILFFSGIRIVKQNTVLLVEFLGKFNRILYPGLNIIIPFLEWTRKQDLYKKNFKVHVDGLTGDNVTVAIGLNVVYFIKNNHDDIFQSVYEIDNPALLIQATIDEQLRSMITDFTHKEIYIKREEIGKNIEVNLKDKLEQFGYTLDSIQVQDIQLESTVLEALNKIVETEKIKEAAFNEAEAVRIKMVKEAEADKEAKKLIGEGMAEQRKAIAQGFKESIASIQSSDKNLKGSDVLEFLLSSARIETLEKVGTEGNSKVIYLNENLEGKNRIEKLLSDS